MIPYWKHVALWLLLFSGVFSVAGNIAAGFGYSGRYTLELVIVCIAASIMLGAVSYRLAKARLAATPRQPPNELIPRQPPNELIPRQPPNELMKALSYQGLTKAQRLRWFFAWGGSAFVFLIVDLIVYQTTLHSFPNLMPQLVIAIALAGSGVLTALFGAVFYMGILAKLFPDTNDRGN